MKKLFLISIFLFVFIIGCKKDEEISQNEELSKVLTAKIDVLDKIDVFELHGENSIKSANKTISYQWTCNSNKITINNAQNSTASFKVPLLDADENIKITLTINDGATTNSADVQITLYGNNYYRIWGLGKQINSQYSTNISYSWYFDQYNTGTCSGVNCGPTSVTMAVKWFNQYFTGTPLDARNTYPRGNGWWYTSDIINYLNSYNVYNKTINLTSINLLKDELNKGNIIILCLDMYYITYNSNPQHHVGKFYTTSAPDWGHFIVIKGYKEVDNNIFYEVYDPYSMNTKYEDLSLKGKDRYYHATDLNEATNIWWDFAIIISKSALKDRGVDTKLITHKFGR